MPKRRNTAAEPTFPPRPCAVEGCPAPAEFRARKSPRALDETIWLCEAHVREHHKTWDYFQGMSAEEIERFRDDALTGHRPTWKMGSQPLHQFMRSEDLMRDFFDRPLERPKPKGMTARERKALETLDMQWPFTEAELKKRYKVLVKRWHPDANPGDANAEETFKAVAQAHETVLKWLKKQET